jgi:chromosome segregation ATPase
MIFSLGNLLAIGIVVLILAIYRQVDKSNRSLEKVKRYADKVKEDLDLIVERKAVEIKDMAIELDVHQKAAREILKRIGGIEKGLNERANEIELIGSRISDYDRVLNELVQMTGRTEENINRIRDESEFVDKVGKRIRNAITKIDQLENNIPTIIDKINIKNNENLKIAEGRAFEVAEARVGQIEENLVTTETRINDFQEFIERLEGRGEDVAAQTEKDIQHIENEASERIRSISRQSVSETEGSYDNFSQKLSDLEEQYNRKLAGIAAKGESLETQALIKLKEHIEVKLKSSAEELSDAIKEKTEYLEGGVLTLERSIENRLEELDENSRKHTQEVFSQLSLNINDRAKILEDDLKNKLSIIDQDSNNSKNKIVGDIDELQQQMNEWSSKINDYLSGCEKTEGDIQDHFDKINTYSHEFITRITQSIKGQQEKVSSFEDDIENRIKQFTDEHTLKLLESGETIESKVVQEVESRLSEYEKDISYRIQKIEDVNIDLDGMEKNIRTAMEKIKENINGDFNFFQEEMNQKRMEDRSESEKNISIIKSDMNELENGLDALKARAYDNVSEKLKVFEDEFFKDLRDRSSDLEQKLNEWQLNVQNDLDRMAESYKEDRENIEENYSESLKEGLHQFKNSFAAQFGQFEETTKNFEEGINQRVDMAEKRFENIQAQINTDFSAFRDDSHQFFQDSFTDYKKQVKDDLAAFDNDIRSNLDDLNSRLNTSNLEHNSMMDSARSDITVWQNQVLQQIKAAETDLGNQFATLKVQVSDTISSLRDDFNSQHNELLESTKTARAGLKNELKVLDDNVHRIENELRVKTEEVMNEFTEKYNSYYASIEKNNKDLQHDTEQKFRDFKTLLQDTGEQFESMQEKLFSKIEEDSSLLKVNLTEIEKRQKNFVEQTKIFERADNLKIKLQENIELLKADLSRVDTQRKEIREMEIQLEKLKKTGNEVSDKMSKFFSEKRKIDGIEADYKRLISLSKSVEVKLENVNSSNDLLQSMQASLRNLQEMNDEVSVRFERLEKKKNILDVTTDGVDRNFQLLEGLENKVSSLYKEVESLPNKLGTIDKEISKIAGDKVKADSAIVKLETIDGLLVDLEGRIDGLQKAREWLARTETRLEEVGKQAQEQVKLLGSIMQDDVKSKGKPGQKGAPNMGARETVTKLAHQGWSVEEIARVTKLSRGEVELILEMLPKS